MDRRSFLLSGAAALLASQLPGIAGVPSGLLTEPSAGPRKKGRAVPADEDYMKRITREVKPLAPLNVKEINLKVGAESPFSVLHLSDTHIARVDNRDDERKIRLAAKRNRWALWGEHYLDEAMRYAAEYGMYLMHTGDLYDFVSEANLDMTAIHMGAADWFVSAGNHEYSKYVGEAKEDEAYKADSRDKVQGAFPNDLTFASRIINGVNFVSLDDVYYNITEAQHALMEAEMKKGLPVVMLCHVPLYTPKHCDYELEHTKGKAAFMTGVPLEITSNYDKGITYTPEKEWRRRSLSQRADKPTLDFVAWLKEQKLLKAILCGHLHHFFEEPFSKTAVEYTVDATFRGGVHAIHFR